MAELFFKNMCMMVDTVYVSPNGTIRGVLAVEHELKSLEFTYKILRKNELFECPNYNYKNFTTDSETGRLLFEQVKYKELSYEEIENLDFSLNKTISFYDTIYGLLLQLIMKNGFCVTDGKTNLESFSKIKFSNTDMRVSVGDKCIINRAGSVEDFIFAIDKDREDVLKGFKCKRLENKSYRNNNYYTIDLEYYNRFVSELEKIDKDILTIPLAIFDVYYRENAIQETSITTLIMMQQDIKLLAKDNYEIQETKLYEAEDYNDDALFLIFGFKPRLKRLNKVSTNRLLNIFVNYLAPLELEVNDMNKLLLFLLYNIDRQDYIKKILYLIKERKLDFIEQIVNPIPVDSLSREFVKEIIENYHLIKESKHSNTYRSGLIQCKLEEIREDIAKNNLVIYTGRRLLQHIEGKVVYDYFKEYENLETCVIKPVMYKGEI